VDSLSARRRNRADLNRLLDVFELHGGDELAVMLVTATRLELGLRHYGPLDVADGRHWLREAGEELVDAGVYGAAEIVRAGRAGDGGHRDLKPGNVIQPADPDDASDPTWHGEVLRRARERAGR
jgi:hypothetical protein